LTYIKINNLQRYSSRTLKSCSNSWININHQVSISLDFSISFFNFGTNPICKLLTNNSIYHIYEILLWKFYNFFLTRKPFHYFRNQLSLFKNGFNSESFILWNMQMLNMFTFDNLILNTKY